MYVPEPGASWMHHALCFRYIVLKPGLIEKPAFLVLDRPLEGRPLLHAHAFHVSHVSQNPILTFLHNAVLYQKKMALLSKVNNMC